MNKEKLISWCWDNLEFNNCPDSWEDTFITDILNGYNGTCHTRSGDTLSYTKIRMMFEEDED